MSVGFWKPIERSDSFWGTAADFYFNYGGEKFTSLNERLAHPDLNENLQKLAVLEKRESVTTGVNTALKMFSMITVVIPVAMLLIKLISRYQMDDYLIKKTAKLNDEEGEGWYQSGLLIHFKSDTKTVSREYPINKNKKLERVEITRTLENGVETSKKTAHFSSHFCKTSAWKTTIETDEKTSTTIFNNKSERETIKYKKNWNRVINTHYHNQVVRNHPGYQEIIHLNSNGKVIEKIDKNLKDGTQTVQSGEFTWIESSEYGLKFPVLETGVELVYDANKTLTKKILREFGQEVLKKEGEFDENEKLKSGTITEIKQARGVETKSVYTLSDGAKRLFSVDSSRINS